MNKEQLKAHTTRSEVVTFDGQHFCKTCLTKKDDVIELRPLRNSTTEFNCPFCSKLKSL